MAAFLKYLSQKTDEIIASQMRRAACRIEQRQEFFPHHAR